MLSSVSGVLMWAILSSNTSAKSHIDEILLESNQKWDALINQNKE